MATSPFITPGALLVFLLGLFLTYVPLSVVAYEDKHKTTTRWSKVCTWLFFHCFEIILLTISSVFAVWRLEHGHSLADAADCFVVPAIWIGGGVFWGWVRKLRRRQR